MTSSPPVHRELPIGITMGCPAGIGPEIILKSVTALSETALPPLVVIGDGKVLERCGRELGMPAAIKYWQPGMVPEKGVLNLYSLSSFGPELRWGHPDGETGRAMGRYIEETVKLIQQGTLGALVTCPISKAALNQGGYRFPGHTEMLASLCAAEEYAMMMAGEKLRVALVTIHIALAEVPGLITREAVARIIGIVGRSLETDFAISQPRIAVAGLNPHGGEGGLFGVEEREAIAPAVAEAAGKGWRVSGPWPPDTVFYQAARGNFDAVVCMYHDQGLIPFKLLHFEDGVNVTLGLPLVRTSVDHGTAYDIAGKGIASPASLISAFRLAARIVNNRLQKGK
jgi:4-hydroxythreonine-4-phosphate dehydrogenase